MKRTLWSLILVLTIVLLCPLAAQAKSNPGKYIFDIGDGDIRIEPMEGWYNRVYYCNENGGRELTNVPETSDITIIGKTTGHNITATGYLEANVRLSGVNVDFSRSYYKQTPFLITNKAMITIILDDRTTNRFDCMAETGLRGLLFSGTQIPIPLRL